MEFFRIVAAVGGVAVAFRNAERWGCTGYGNGPCQHCADMAQVKAAADAAGEWVTINAGERGQYRHWRPASMVALYRTR